MKSKAPAYQRYPKQIMGDQKVLLMDWDTYGMHNWLMDISWQEDQRGTIPDDEEVIRKWLRNPIKADWKRIWPQLKRSWPVIAPGLRGNSGMIATSDTQVKYSKAGAGNVRKRYESSTDHLGNDLPNAHEIIEDEEEVVVDLDLDLKKEPIFKSESIYAIYPRKVGRRKALAAIDQAHQRLMRGEKPFPIMTSGEAGAFLSARTAAYAQSPVGNNGQYTPHPATWYHGSRYLDDEQEWQLSPRNEGHSNGNNQQKFKGQHGRNFAEERQQRSFDAIERAAIKLFGEDAIRPSESDEGVVSGAGDDRGAGNDDPRRLGGVGKGV